MNQKDLLDLKEQIEDAKSEVSKLEGRKEHLEQQLEEDWDCSSLDEAKAKLKELKAEAESIGQKIEKGITELEEKYEFG